MRLRGDDGDVVLYAPDFSGGTRKHVYRRPIPLSRISPDFTVHKCAESIMEIYAIFVLVATRASEELIGFTFAAGKPTTTLQRISTAVLTKIVSDPTLRHFRGNYNYIASGQVCQWLIDNEPEAWDFTPEKIKENAFAHAIHKETMNLVCFLLYVKSDSRILLCFQVVSTAQ